mgnify:CR=1 FL=1
MPTKTETAARRTYYETCAMAKKTYREAEAAARETLAAAGDNFAAALKTYEETNATAWEIYIEGCIAAMRTYEESMDDLETRCNQCSGTGVVYSPEWAAWWNAPTGAGDVQPSGPEEQPCRGCGGLGMVLTLKGEILISFLKRRWTPKAG